MAQGLVNLSAFISILWAEPGRRGQLEGAAQMGQECSQFLNGTARLSLPLTLTLPLQVSLPVSVCKLCSQMETKQIFD